MRLAKAALDVGLFTNQLDPMLAFWQREIGLPFHETLPVGDGVRQLRHGIGESVLKINHSRDPLPSAPPAGYRHLTIARSGVAAARELTDPDGNRVTLVPPGHNDIQQLQMHLHVRDPAAHHDFFGRVLGLDPTGDGRYRCGISLLSLEHDALAGIDAQMRGIGFRYLTIQVFDVVGEHHALLARGASEGLAPRRLGDVAAISFVRDPDGNWIEISQRKSITGSLERP
jgi:catechol 2,3-dioxygenase-like lactoylglutathione lyase family enzyme